MIRDPDAALIARLTQHLSDVHGSNGGDWADTARHAMEVMRADPQAKAKRTIPHTSDMPREDD